MLKMISFIGYVITGLFGGLSSGFGQVLVEHSGAIDPLTEGFVKYSFATNTVVGPVVDDIGRDSWAIEAPLGGGGTPSYRYDLSSAEQQAALSQGWRLFGRMRFAEDGIGVLRFVTGQQDFFLSFWLRENGNIEIWDVDELSYTLTQAGQEYHEYEIVYDAVDQVASLWIGGVGRVAYLSGRGSSAETFITFGVGQGSTRVHWNAVSFSIVPEPAAVGLFIGGVVLVLAGTLRRRRMKEEL